MRRELSLISLISVIKQFSIFSNPIKMGTHFGVFMHVFHRFCLYFLSFMARILMLWFILHGPTEFSVFFFKLKERNPLRSTRVLL